MPERTAVLIDWENVRRGLNQQDYWYGNVDLVKLLMAKVEEALEMTGNTLAYVGAFAPPGVFSNGVSEEIQRADGRIRIEMTMSGKNAADTELILRAAELFAEGVQRFVIASGDVDFIPLAYYLQRNERTCEIWATDENRSRSELYQYDNTTFLPKLLNLQTSDRPSADDTDLLVLAVLKLCEDGQGVWSYPRAIESLSRMIGREPVAVERMWSDVSARGLFIDARISERGKNFKRRRLAYDHPIIRELTSAVDLVVKRAHLATIRNGSVSRSELTEASGQLTGLDSERLSPIVDGMIQVGMLIGDVRSVRLERPSLRHGTESALLRLALLVESTMRERKWNVVGRSVVARSWRTHYKPGGNLSDADERNAQAEATALLEKGRASSMLRYAEDPNGRRGYALAEDHPVVTRVRALLDTLSQNVVSISGRGAVTAEEFGQLLPLGEQQIGDLWLSALAGQRIISWKRRDNAVRLTNRKALGRKIEKPPPK